jgi:Leucine-rich repeat (LRR) protein
MNNTISFWTVCLVAISFEGLPYSRALFAQEIDHFEMRVAAFGGALTKSQKGIELHFGNQSRLDGISGARLDHGITHIDFDACLSSDSLLREVLLANNRVVSVKVNNSDVKNALNGIESYPHLSTLDVSGTSIEDFSFLARMPKLEELYLAYSCFQNKDVRYISEIASLKSLDVTYTNLSDSGLEELCKLRNLETLRVAGPEANDQNYQIFLKYPALKTLIISRPDSYGGWLHSQLSKTSIEALQAHGIDVQGTPVEPNILVTLQADIGIEDRRITWNQLCELESPEKVTKLSLLCTAVNDNCVSEIKRFTNLRELSLSGAPITDKSLQVVSTLTELRSLDLENTRVSDLGFEKYWTSKSKIEHLNLAATAVVGTGISSWDFPNLKTLDLSRSSTDWKTVRQLPSLTDAGIRAIAKLDSLEELTVSWDKSIDDELFVIQISSLSNLKELYTFSKKFSEAELKLLVSKNKNLTVTDIGS